MSNPYKLADSYSCRSGNPADEPEAPEVDDIPSEHLRSSCCGAEVTKTSNGAYKCYCTFFCKIDVDLSFSVWCDYETQ